MAFRDGVQPPARAINDFFDYGRALIAALLEAQGNQHLHSDDWQRTIYIDSLGVSTTDFELDRATRNKLVASGRAGVKTYFDWFNHRDALPVNRG